MIFISKYFIRDWTSKVYESFYALFQENYEEDVGFILTESNLAISLE